MLMDFAIELHKMEAEFFSGAPFMFLWKTLAQGSLSIFFWLKV